MGVLIRVSVCFGLHIGVRVRIGVLVSMSMPARRFVGRVTVVLRGRGNATSRPRGRRGNEQHEH